MLDTANIEHDFRKCTECGFTLPTECFRFQNGKRPRYRSKCKECEGAAFKDRFKASGSKWGSRTPEARQAERAKAAEKAGRYYRSLGPIEERAQAKAVKEAETRAQAEARKAARAQRPSPYHRTHQHRGVYLQILDTSLRDVLCFSMHSRFTPLHLL
jgi:hypothetical protein